MALDVAVKVFPSEPIRNGYAITAVDKQGNFQRVAPLIDEDIPNVDGLFTQLGDRFDDINYYTHSGVS